MLNIVDDTEQKPEDQYFSNKLSKQDVETYNKEFGTSKNT